ncbi:hypothetical protein C8250_028855 [Streptomyces sp. So13.3]|uniref:hypothetical protein n=1 Tax=Streptomyces sp. So13.3 TaxID=2136173 RepID=UPI001106EAE4|nr:hypothetical protein [Streptomyces sp. So13.3]QNA75363.1 hypothetical protein C8250_028855 [Streptomyces sp. So13.3]
MTNTTVPVPQDKNFDFEKERQEALDIAGYFSAKGLICPPCLREHIIPYWPIARAGGSTTENILNEYARKLDLDREKENFSPDVFPHRLYADMRLGGDRCRTCFRKL